MVDATHDFFEQQWSRSSSNRAPFRSNYSIAANQVISLSKWIASTDAAIIERFVDQTVKDSPVMVAEGRGKLYAYDVVDVKAGKSLLHIVMVASDPEGLTRTEVKSMRGFYPSFSFIPAPTKGLSLWLEKGSWVAGFSRNGKWVQIVTLGRLQATMLMQRIQQIYADLLVKGAIDDFDKIKVLGSPDRQVSEFFIGHPIDFVPLKLRSPAEYSIVPNLVGDEAYRRKQLRDWVLTVAGIVLLCLGLFAFARSKLESKRKEIGAVQVHLNELIPIASEISSEKTRWSELGAASTPEKSPIEVLYQLSRISGPKGIRFADFEFVEDNVNFSVQATSVKDAARFEAALEKSEALRGYSWVAGRHEFVNKLYSFRCSGKWEGLAE